MKKPKLPSSEAIRHMKTARKLHKNNALEDAIKEYELATIEDPEFAEAYNGWGDILYEQEKYKPATEKHATAVAKNGKVARYYKNLGADYYGLEDFVKAGENYRLATQIDANDAEAYLYWGESLYELKDLPGAKEKFNIAFRLDKKSAEIYNNLGRVLLEERDWMGAIDKFRIATEIDPGFSFAYYNWAEALVELRRYGEAIEKYEQAAKANDKDADPIASWGDVLYSQRNYDAAIVKYKEAVAVDDKCAAALNGWGIVLAELKRYDEALEMYEKAFQADETHVYALHNAAYLLDKQGKYREAVSKWEKAAQQYNKVLTEPNEPIRDPNLFLYYGTILQSVFRKSDDAEKQYKLGLKMKPDDVGILAALAGLCSEVENDLIVGNDQSTLERRNRAHWECRQYCRKAREVFCRDPNMSRDPELLLSLGQMHLWTKEYSEARKELLEALKLDPELAEVYSTLGVIAIREDNPNEAITFFQEALKRDPDDLNLKSNLGDAFSRAKYFEQAKQQYEEVLVVAPNHIESIIGLGEVYTGLGDLTKDSALFERSIGRFSEAIGLAPDYHPDKRWWKAGHRGASPAVDPALIVHDVHRSSTGVSKVLRRKELAAVFYSRGYARVRMYECGGPLPNRRILNEAREDLERVVFLDPDDSKAKDALAKLKRGPLSPVRTRWERIGPGLIASMALLLLFLGQWSYFVGRPSMKADRYELTDQVITALKGKPAITADISKQLETIKNLPTASRKDFLESLKAALDPRVYEAVSPTIADEALISGTGMWEPMQHGYYVLLSFGSLIFLMAGLCLPQILKLQIGGIKLEKEQSAQITAVEALGISK